MAYLWCFLCGGVLCAIGQLFIDRTQLTPARILTGYVVAGVVLQALGVYQPLVGIYRFEAIRSVFSTDTTDASVRSFLRRLNPAAVEMSAADTADVDTWEQAQALGYTTSLWSSY